MSKQITLSNISESEYDKLKKLVESKQLENIDYTLQMEINFVRLEKDNIVLSMK